VETGDIENRGAIELVKTQAKEKRKNFFIGTCCIAGVLLVGTICYQFIVREYSVDSLLSTILALFSVGIAILFFFKADTSSAKFYDKVYEFNNTQEALLRKIDLVLNHRIDEVMHVVSEIRKEENKVQIIEQRKDASTNDAEKIELESALLKSKMELDNLNNKLVELSNFQKNSIMNDGYPYTTKNLAQRIVKHFSLEELNDFLLKKRIDRWRVNPVMFNSLEIEGVVDFEGRLTQFGMDMLKYTLDSYLEKFSN